jgi:hypothetical protein
MEKFRDAQKFLPLPFPESALIYFGKSEAFESTLHFWRYVLLEETNKHPPNKLKLGTQKTK